MKGKHANFSPSAHRVTLYFDSWL